MRHSLLLLLGALLLLTGCQAGETAARLREIDACARTAPDSALIRLRAVPEASLTSAPLQAKYSLLHAKLLYKNFIDTTDLHIIAPATAWYANHGTPVERIETRYYRGCILLNREEYPEAAIALSEAADLAAQAGESHLEGLICASLSLLYNRQHNYAEQLAYAERSSACFEASGEKDYRQYADILRGVALHNQRRFEEAAALYRAVLADHPDRTNRRDAMAHLALTQTARSDNRVAEADSLFSAVLAETGKLPNRNMWGAYAYILDLQHRPAEADAIYARLDTADLVNYGWYARSLCARGDYRNAYRYLSASIEHQSDLLNIALTQAAQKGRQERAEALRQEAENANRVQRLTYLAIILLILAVAGLFFVVIRQRYKRIREENARLAQVAESVHAQLQEMETAPAGDSLQDAYIRLYQSQFKEIGILHEALLYSDSHGTAPQRVLAEVRRLVKDIREDTAGNRRFEEMIDAKLSGVMTRFRADFPGRPESDYRLMSFIIAGFDATTLALLLDLPSNAAAYMRKSRLKSLVASAAPDKRKAYLRYF